MQKPRGPCSFYVCGGGLYVCGVGCIVVGAVHLCGWGGLRLCLVVVGAVFVCGVGWGTGTIGEERW